MTIPVASKIRSALRLSVTRIRRLYLTYFWRMDIGEGTVISLSAKLDKTNPRGVHIGKYTSVTFGVTILTHDFVNNRLDDVRIGDNCFIGAHSVILPGATIGNNCIVAAASVVAKNVPAGSLVFGNPARVLESNLRTGHYGVRTPREPAASGVDNATDVNSGTNAQGREFSIDKSHTCR
jgi:acetoacetyl-CoA synthetase